MSLFLEALAVAENDGLLSLVPGVALQVSLPTGALFLSRIPLSLSLGILFFLLHIGLNRNSTSGS